MPPRLPHPYWRNMRDFADASYNMIPRGRESESETTEIVEAIPINTDPTILLRPGLVKVIWPGLPSRLAGYIVHNITVYSKVGKLRRLASALLNRSPWAIASLPLIPTFETACTLLHLLNVGFLCTQLYRASIPTVLVILLKYMESKKVLSGEYCLNSMHNNHDGTRVCCLVSLLLFPKFVPRTLESTPKSETVCWVNLAQFFLLCDVKFLGVTLFSFMQQLLMAFAVRREIVYPARELRHQCFSTLHCTVHHSVWVEANGRSYYPENSRTLALIKVSMTEYRSVPVWCGGLDPVCISSAND